MNCLECFTKTPRAETTAIAACARCGAGACLEHAHQVTRAAQQSGRVPGHPSSREIRCTYCEYEPIADEGYG